MTPYELASFYGEFLPVAVDVLLDLKNDQYDSDPLTWQEIKNAAEEKSFDGDEFLRIVPHFEHAHAMLSQEQT